MSKKYDIFSKSDMNKFMSDLGNDLVDAIQDELNHYKCDNCHKPFKANVGKNVCPHCKSKINISFEN